MAARPWVTPQEVRDYTEYESVKNRSDEKLAIDISRAESYVIAYTNNDFANYAEIPTEVKTAVILIAERYAYNATNISVGMYKSETFDDYSYTLSDNANLGFDDLFLGELLDGFILSKSDITIKLRRL
jgi:hypothetical protein